MQRIFEGQAVVLGRSDLLEHAPDLSIADLARKASCSFATAWQAAQDYRLLQAAGPNARQE